MTSMMYVSDHGQALYDGSCTLALHGHNTQHDFHVPALVWYSDLYRHTHPSTSPRRDNLHNFAGRSGRAAALLVVAIARYDSSSRLASHPATSAKLHKLFLRGA
ncbi:MAG: hypothetical protein V7606_1301 [Burkholderiales bacterium]